MKEQKKQLRKQIREEKKRHLAHELTATSAALLEQIEKHPRFIASRTILCYYSLGDEVQTHDFVEKWHTSKKILLPVVVDDILKLRHYTGKDCLHMPSSAIAMKVPVSMIIVNSILFINFANAFHTFADKPWRIPITKG